MKWNKLGKIFDPSEFKLTNNCHDYAQAPQALVFNNFVRIYFSTRERDKYGKYLSHIAFVDFDKKFQNVIRVSKHTIINLGDQGCFDEHGIFPIHIFRDNKKIYAFTTGWNRKVSVSADASIGLAISEDNGLTFKKLGNGPILTSSLYEPFLIGDPFVIKIENIYHMWYIYGTIWIKFSENELPERVYKIGHAISKDCLSWQKEGRQLVSDKLGPDECQALPTVIRIDGRLHMFFCYRQPRDFRNSKDAGYKIGYAYSNDMIKWIRDDNNSGIYLSPKGWDSEMQCYPHIFAIDNNIYLLYNGNEFGRHGFGLAILEKLT